MPLTRTLRLLAAAVILALTLAACAGDDATNPSEISDEDTTAGDPAPDTDATGAEPADAGTEPTDGQTDAATGGSTEADAEAVGTTGDLSLVTEGTLTVCTEAPYAPFEVEDPSTDSGYSGFDIEIVAEIAERLALDFAVVNTGFDALTSGTAMASGTCDMAISAMTITEEREENIDFSEPYYNAAQSLLVPAGSDITSLDQVEGRLGVQSGTTGEAYAQENAPDTAEIVAFDAGADLFVALAAGDIVAILQDLPVNVERAQQDDSLEVVETYETDEEYGMAFEQGANPDLLEAVNGALEQMRGDGTYDEIYESYFSQDA